MNSSNPAPVLSAKNLTKSFYDLKQIQVLKNITIDLYPHKSAAIIGKSGEGKTTLLHILGTLEKPTTGILSIHGREVLAKDRDLLRNRHFGFIFQAFHLIQDSSVLENILMPAKIARRKTDKRSEAYHRARELAAMVGLDERIHFSCMKLSGGEKQRVAIARAFMNDPDILFADEPTGNLDHETAHEVQQLLLQSVKNQGKALLLVTHNLEFARLLDDCYELDGGILKLV
jgi:lipoprotein-releasing system ATP-binding protein